MAGGTRHKHVRHARVPPLNFSKSWKHKSTTRIMQSTCSNVVCCTLFQHEKQHTRYINQHLPPSPAPAAIPPKHATYSSASRGTCKLHPGAFFSTSFKFPMYSFLYRTSQSNGVHDAPPKARRACGGGGLAGSQNRKISSSGEKHHITRNKKDHASHRTEGKRTGRGPCRHNRVVYAPSLESISNPRYRLQYCLLQYGYVMLRKKLVQIVATTNNADRRQTTASRDVTRFTPFIRFFLHPRKRASQFSVYTPLVAQVNHTGRPWAILESKHDRSTPAWSICRCRPGRAVLKPFPSRREQSQNVDRQMQIFFGHVALCWFGCGQWTESAVPNRSEQVPRNKRE